MIEKDIPISQSPSLSLSELKTRNVVKNSGILTVIFGGIGLVVSILFCVYILASGNRDPVSGTVAPIDPLFFIVFFSAIFVFSIAPQAFLIISGQHLLRSPLSLQSKKLIIANLVIGALTNVVVLIASIVALDALSRYERSQVVDSPTLI